MSVISNCTETVIKNAAASLIEGNLVAFPTETVYGLGADATNEDAVSRVYEVKARPAGHPLIVHISSIEYLDKWASNIPEYAIKLARTFWPGPMTLLFPRSNLAKDFVTGGQESIGLRIPNNIITLELFKNFEELGGLGIAAPSANRYGAVSPTSAPDVQSDIGEYLTQKDVILNGGNCEIGIESTIIDCTTSVPLILRPGSITSSMILTVTGINIKFEKKMSIENNTRVSGMLKNHYSPNARIILNDSAKEGDGFIALSEIATPPGAIRLASPQNSFEFANVLYKSFRLGDEKHLKRIIVIPPNTDDFSVAILDRLEKASFKI